MRPLIVSLLLLPTLALAATSTVPNEKELKTLALDSMRAFNQAIQAKDFTAFHAYISKLWQQQITPEKLKEVFQTFIDQEMDLSSVSKVDPVFEPAATINAGGVLVLEGYYPAAPSKVEFRLKYVNEKSAWKLFGIKLNVAPAGGAVGEIPSEEDARTLALASLLTFNQAVVSDDFSVMHEYIAEAWRNETTPEKLQAIFQSFVDKGIDLTPIEKVKPEFHKPPALNEKGLLELQGTYPTRPTAVRFDLAYLYEAPDWKLVKIKVNVERADEEEESESESPDE